MYQISIVHLRDLVLHRFCLKFCQILRTMLILLFYFYMITWRLSLKRLCTHHNRTVCALFLSLQNSLFFCQSSIAAHFFYWVESRWKTTEIVCLNMRRFCFLRVSGGVCSSHRLGLNSVISYRNIWLSRYSMLIFYHFYIKNC